MRLAETGTLGYNLATLLTELEPICMFHEETSAVYRDRERLLDILSRI
jgi:hypothetical protein